MYFDPYKEEEPYGKCDVCGETVYVGETVYLIGALTVCEGCVEQGRGIAVDSPL
ncbi:MAG: hypothetical protein IKR53_00850 [Clostridia bacterium]|nr:hypothetical protein [Clostridia bacterium]MBR3991636.1 hypothetical protein [Clostridia bacterium]MBR6289965.1 hypothetical protein [Clostridia bacterium]